MDNVALIKQQAANLIGVIDQIEIETKAATRSKESLEESIKDIMERNRENREALDIATNAITILQKVSDEAVGKAYRFLEQSLNSALAKMFTKTTRKIELKESLRNNQYPQLKIILHVGNGKTRSLKNDSGHGLAQIVSLLSILSLIVITGSRRILVMDEILSGLDVHNRQVVNDIMWTFTEIGFQFIVNDHGFVPENSRVYHLEMVGDVSNIKQTYLATKGVYLQSDGNSDFDYSETDLEDIIRQSGGQVSTTKDAEVQSSNTAEANGLENNSVLSI